MTTLLIRDVRGMGRLDARFVSHSAGPNRSVMGPCVGYPSYPILSYPEDKKKLIFHTDALHTCLSDHLGLICTNLNIKKNHFLHDIDAVVVLRVTILTNSRPLMSPTSCQEPKFLTFLFRKWWWPGNLNADEIQHRTVYCHPPQDAYHSLFPLDAPYTAVQATFIKIPSLVAHKSHAREHIVRFCCVK